MIGYQFFTKKVVMYNTLIKKYIDALCLNKIPRVILGALLISLITLTTINDSFATMGGRYGSGRLRTCSSSGDPGSLDFNPLAVGSSKVDGKDIEFVLSNPVCVTVILTTYASVITAIAAMNGFCATGSPVPRVIPSPIMDAIDLYKGGKAAFTSTDVSCPTAFGVAMTSWTAAFVELAVIYGIALNTYNNTSICGFGWKNPNHEKKNFSSGGIEEERSLTIAERIRSYQSDPAAFEGDPDKRRLLGLDGVDVADKVYREWYYGGVEVEDNLPFDLIGNIGDAFTSDSTSEFNSNTRSLFDNDACRDPLRPKESSGLRPPQRYYLRGTTAGNYNCERYLSNVDGVSSEEMSQAYGCCQARSREYVCIDYGVWSSMGNTLNSANIGSELESEKIFCRAGTLCDIRGITFSTKFIDNDRMICAESYSLCPYNFTLSGGTEVCDYYRDGKQNSAGHWNMISAEEIEAGDCVSKSEIRNADCTYNDNAGKCKNYCQYLTHCAATSSIPFEYKSSIGSPYFANACLDFQGDSQNISSYSGLRHFSLPIAQCMKETLENLFYNRAGHSMCATISELPDKNGVCTTGYSKTKDGYEYKLGGQVEHKSFFERIQDALRDFVKIMLTFAVVFFGIGILIGKINLGNKKDSIMFIVKFSLVLYFSIGTAWQSKFFDGVYNASSDFAMMVFKINAGETESKRDGCQFGDITLPDGSLENSGRNYPEGKKYLAIFDTLDCKLARYLGFGPEATAAGIAKLVFAGYFIGPIGIYFSMCLLIIGFFMIALTIRALHIFLSSILGIILMVLISPLLIPTVLFEKTSNLFKGWLKQLISFTLQPMILFAYIAIFVTVVDATMLGSATFTGKAPNKKVSCEKNCYFTDTGLISLQSDGITSSECTSANEKFIDPMNDSVACLLNMDDFGSWPGLEWLGLSIPILENLLSGNVKQKILTLLKAALVMTLLYGFMDEISGISSQIIGGAKLPSAGADPMAMFAKIAGKPGFSFSKGFDVKGGAVNEAQKRMTRGSQKLLMAGAEKAMNAAQRVGDKGKSVDASEGSSDGGSSADQSGNDNNGGGTSGDTPESGK